MSTSEHKVILTAQDNASATLKKVEGNFDGLGTMLKRIAVGVGAFEVAKGVVKLGSQAEQAAISFETLLKSGTNATAMLKDIEDFAAKTPFEKAGLTEGVQKLLGMGIAAERALPTMQVLGDAVSAVGGGKDQLDGVVLALGQIQAKGKLSMEETLQIAERGIPIFDILREQLGLTQDQIGNLGKEGIKSSVAIDAILTGMNTRFAGAMEKQSKTLAGQWSTAMDNVKNTATGIIAPVNAALASGLAAANGFFTENEKAIKETGGRITETFVDLFTAGAATFGGIAGAAGLAFDAITDEQAKSGGTWMENFRLIQSVLSKSLAGILIAVNTGVQSVLGAASQAINALRLIAQTVAGLIVGTIGEAINSAVNGFNWMGTQVNAVAEKMGISFRVGTVAPFGLAEKAAIALKGTVSDSFKDMDATQKAFGENLGKSNAAIYDSLFKSADDYDVKLKTANDTASKGPSIMERNLAEIKKMMDELAAGKGDMFQKSGGGKSGKSEGEKMKEEMEKTKESASALYSQLDKEAVGHKERVSELQRGYGEMKDRLGEMVLSGRAQVKALSDTFKDMGEKFSTEIGKMKAGLATLDKEFGKQTQDSFKDLATRAADLKKQMADANKELVGSGGTGKEEEIRDKIRKLEAEYALAKTKVTEEDIKKAQEEADKGETQKILDRMAADKLAYDEKRKAIEDDIIAKTKAHETDMAQFAEKAIAKKLQLEDEIKDFKRQMAAKNKEIRKEVALYVEVMAAKRAIDDAYFANFSKQIKAQASELDSVLAKMSKAGIAGGGTTVTGAQARADGGSVMPGQAYVVGENRPELFIADRPGTIVPQVGGGGVSVSINMGGVTVRNDSDIRAIASAIKDELTREIRLAKMGVA